MPRARIPAVWPCIQLFFRSITASIDSAAFVIAIIASVNGYHWYATYVAALGSFVVDAAEILGLTSTDRRIPRASMCGWFLELLTLTAWILSFFFLIFSTWNDGDRRYYYPDWVDVKEPWIMYLHYLTWPSMGMRFIYMIAGCVDCCVSRKRNKRLGLGEFARRQTVPMNNVVVPTNNVVYR